MSFPLEQYIQNAKALDKSPEFIKATRDYAQNLLNNGYPVIFSLEHLAILMGVQSDYLRYLIGDPKSTNWKHTPYKKLRYNYYKLKKKRGGFREIMSPSKELKYIQKWIYVNILSKFPLRDSCKGFRKGISIKDNAMVHEGADVLLKVDLLRYYDTITEQMVFGVFADMGYAKNLAVSLAKLTTAEHRSSYWKSIPEKEREQMGVNHNDFPAVLPQGAPSSPAIANIVATQMDKRFDKLSEKLGYSYSRYADDLTFSIKNLAKLPTQKLIRIIISEEKFVINENKIKYFRRGNKQFVTGLTIANGINVPKKYRKFILSEIHYCKTFGPVAHLERNSKNQLIPQNTLVYHDWLLGHICFIKSINEKAGNKMFEEFNKINWPK